MLSVIRFQKQRGFHLPVALILISLILLVSTKFSHSVVATQQEIVAEYQQLTGLRSAEMSLAAGEQRISETTDVPFVVYNLVSDGVATQLSPDNVWNDTLNTYNLDYAAELITGDALTWIDQPVRWWEAYAVPLDGDENGYYAIEYVSEDVFGSDLGQEKNYQGSLSRYFFKVTARGVGDNAGATVLQSNFSRVY